MNTSHDMFFCHDLRISLTANDCCHEDSCSFAAECLVINPLSIDTDALGIKGYLV